MHSSGKENNAPRLLIPLKFKTTKYATPKAVEEGLPETIYDHYIVATNVGTNDDIRAAVSAEAIKYNTCLVPYAAVRF